MKRSQKWSKHCKWKTCRTKTIVATNFLHCWWMQCLLPHSFYRQLPLYELPPNLKRKSWAPLSLLLKFPKISTRPPLNKRVHTIVTFYSKTWKPEATTKGVLWKKVFLEISQNLSENTCARIFFLIKLQP